MKVLHALFVFFFISVFTTNAQLEVTTGWAASDLANMLAGGGVYIVDAELDCTSLAYGKFECVDCNLGIDSGFVLTTGRATYAEGPNNSGSTGYNNGTTGDPDLDVLPGVGTTYDRCILEIDFIPECDTVKFNYAFGSDEYNEFVGSINDVFALWISGPGITGAVNIALIPGTTLPVAIDNVNLSSYSEYYNNNPATGVALTDPYYIEYDGFTDVFQAASVVTPGET
ncbi:MAG: choice-of-anchor L domain-containing protein, partial [Chitinophagales bacterium]